LQTVAKTGKVSSRCDKKSCRETIRRENKGEKAIRQYLSKRNLSGQEKSKRDPLRKRGRGSGGSTEDGGG